MKIHYGNGFTFVEVMISVLIGTVILQAIYTMVLIGQKSWDNYANNMMPKQEVRRGLTAIVSELREAKGKPEIETDSTSAKIDFERPVVGKVSYSWTTEGADAHKIIRTQNKKKRILAKDITSFSIKSPKENEIFIALTSGKDESFSLNQSVALRLQTGLFLQGKNEAIK
jgi:hypothetical protein